MSKRYMREMVNNPDVFGGVNVAIQNYISNVGRQVLMNDGIKPISYVGIKDDSEYKVIVMYVSKVSKLKALYIVDSSDVESLGTISKNNDSFILFDTSKISYYDNFTEKRNNDINEETEDTIRSFYFNINKQIEEHESMFIHTLFVETELSDEEIIAALNKEYCTKVFSKAVYDYVNLQLDIKQLEFEKYLEVEHIIDKTIFEEMIAHE